MSIYLFNRIIDNPDPPTTLLYLISNDPSFLERINKFWKLFAKTYEGHITKANFSDLFTNIYTFLQPQFSFTENRLFVEQKVAKLITNGQYIYKSFLEIFLEICSQIIENIDLKSAIGFLDLLWQRTINELVISTKDEVQIVPMQVSLYIYHREDIEKDAIEPRNVKLLPLNSIYYEQRIEYLSFSQQNTPTHSLIYQLKPQQEIIPMGYICQSVISNLVNSNFQFKQEYTLMPQIKIKLSNINIKLKYEDKALDPIKDCLINRQIMNLMCVLKQGLPSEFNLSANQIQSYRISEYFTRNCYFQQLKTNDSHVVFCNILSSFHDRSEFNIDQIHNVRDKWNKKRKVTLLSDEKKIPSKIPINVEEEMKIFSIKMAEKNIVHLNQQRLNKEVSFLKQKLKSVLEQNSVINLEQYISNFETLPSDNSNTFVHDLQEYSQLIPLQLLIVGRGKSGRSFIAQQISKKYNLVYVSISTSINKLFERVKYFQQNPPDVDEDGNPKESLTPIEKYLVAQLEKGKFPSQEDILDLLNREMKSIEAQTKGFILDLPLESYDWVKRILNNDLFTPKIKCQYFSHIVELEQTDEQWKWFVQGLKEDPDKQTITSKYQRFIMTKPKPVPIEGQQEQDEPVQDEQEKPPLIQESLIPLQVKQNKIPNLSQFTNHIHPRNHLKVKISGKNVQQILDILSLSLYSIPLAKKIEGSDKDLLSVGLQELKIFRKWSVYGTFDVVALYGSKLTNGKSQFAAEYAGRVFLFDNQINQQLFIKSPIKYLTTPPQLPNNFNIVINGPSKSGKRTLAARLAEIYKLKIVDIEEIVTNILEVQKNAPEHIPSNFDPRSNSIHLSQNQWKQFSKGGPLNPKDIVPIVLYKIGVKLQKKPWDWGIERTEEQALQFEKQRQQKQKEQLAKRNIKKSKKKQTKQVKQQQVKTAPLQDLSLANIIPEVNHNNKLEQIKGFIFIGYPTTQEQLNSFKFFNIPIDKYILLTDSSEQNSNKVLRTRLSDAEFEQIQTFTTLVNAVKDQLGEQIVKQFQIDDTVDNIIVKIRTFIDPFFIKVDDDTYNRVSADKQEQDDPVQYGFCGQYCPVVLEQGWLLKGKDELECGVQGKRFKCFEQKELNLFKQNPSRYFTSNHKKAPPRIMMMGIRGVGLTTSLLKLNEQTKIPILNLKDNLISHIENSKLKRRTQRYYNRGFKVPEAAEGEEQNVVDADLDEQDPQFDRKQSEIGIIKNIFNGIQQILINGNYYDVPQQVVQTPLVELLMQSHRLPQVVVMLRVDQKRWMQRVFNVKEIEREHQQIVRQALQQKKLEINEARQKAIDDGEQFEQPQGEPEIQVISLEDLINERKTKLREQRESDLSQLQQLTQKFQEYGVQVINIDCERDVIHVLDKIKYNLKPYLQNRVERWGKIDTLKIEPERAKDFLNNYIAKESKYGKLNPLTLRRPLKPYPIIHKDRIYYLDNQEERDMVYNTPSLLNQRQAIPKDILITPIVYVIGKPKTGKSQLVSLLSKKLGFVKIILTEIIEGFVQQHNDSFTQSIFKHLRSGGTISDQHIVSLIEKRVQMKDCLEKGWVLDGFPNTRNQAQLLIKKGLAPFAVFSLQLSTTQLKRRVSTIVDTKYSFDPSVFVQRINQFQKQQILIENLFMEKYNNIRFLDAKVSKWGIFQVANNYISQVLDCRQNAAKDILCKQPIKIMDLGFSFNSIRKNLSDYKNYCLVTFRAQRQYIKCELSQPRFVSLYKGQVYVSSTSRQLDDFCNNPDLYIQQPKSFSPPEMILPSQLLQKSKIVHNKGYCMVELSKGKLLKGYPLLSIEYRQKIYGVGSSFNAKMFLKNPGLYWMSTLQDKLPVEIQKKSQLKKIAKRNDCTAFLQHHLGNILMRVLAQLGYRRLKYPTVSSKQTALKFLAISLKASNPNKDEQYRQKYKQKLDKFIKHCNYSQDLKNQYERKEKLGEGWTSWDQENLLKLSEEYYEFMKDLSASDKAFYFSDFIN